MTIPSHLTVEDIASSATKVLHDTQLFRLPVDVDCLAERLGIKVHYEDLEDDYSGLLVIRDGQALAYINSKHHPNRQRFSLAHEIGHFVLHESRRTDKENAYVDKSMRLYQRSDRGYSRMEWQANVFAAQVLMPSTLLRSKIFDEGYDLEDEHDVARLAVVLKVSEQALSIRLTQMKDLLSPIFDPKFDNSSFAQA